MIYLSFSNKIVKEIKQEIIDRLSTVDKVALWNFDPDNPNKKYDEYSDANAQKCAEIIVVVPDSSYNEDHTMVMLGRGTSSEASLFDRIFFYNPIQDVMYTKERGPIVTENNWQKDWHRYEISKAHNGLLR